MRLSFRAKLMTIVGATALALLALTLINTLTAQRVARQLDVIEKSYLPRMALGPKLEREFERLRRGMQDAVAAQDFETLGDTNEIKAGLLAQLGNASSAVKPYEAAAVRSAVEDYYAEAYAVSKRMIAGETGENLVAALGAMQAKQLHAAEVIGKVGAFDRAELARAFLAATREEATATRLRLAVSIGCLALVLLLTLGVSGAVLRSLAALGVGFERFGRGEFERPIVIVNRDEIGELGLRANQMAHNLDRLSKERDRSDWLKTGQVGLTHELRGELEPSELGTRAVRFLARYLDAPAGAIYYGAESGTLELLGHHALSVGAQGGAGKDGGTLVSSFRRGEGLVGEAAQQHEIVVIDDVPDAYFRLRSGLGEAVPRSLLFLPLLHIGRVTGVLELASFKPWPEHARELLVSVRETLAIAIEVAVARSALRGLLLESQRQAKQLSAQEDELRATNEELEAQRKELQNSNDELTRQTDELNEQRQVLEEKNLELDEARKNLERKAGELERVSAYKSQFLANMSHELRTPLNSLLLLSNLLADNEQGNLSDKQVEFCKTIHGAGKDLLALINQVLDLAKVESGKQELMIEALSPARVIERARQMFEPLARDRGLAFVAELAPGVPATIASDVQRVEQVLNNLLGNAIKFTEHGSVTLRIGPPTPSARLTRDDLQPQNCLAFSVNDTGIGIAPEHQARIFAPFEQVDARPDRRYGGTGLGLAIARELAALLGGELQLESEAGRGSTFTCFLPLAGPALGANGAAQPRKSQPVREVPPPPDAARRDSDIVGVNQERSGPLLVIEDDPVFADILREIIEGQGLPCLLAHEGKSGLRLAQEHAPRGVILDMTLADMDGFAVLEALQADARTTAIPVHIVSALEASERGIALGAVGYLTKPATRSQLVQVVQSLARRVGSSGCDVLIVEDDTDTADTVMAQLEHHGFEVTRVSSAREALDALRNRRFDCMVLDLGLPDMDGLDLLETLQQPHIVERPPIVIYTGRALSKAETQRLESYAETVVLKDGSAVERLTDELRIFAQRLKQGRGPKTRHVLRSVDAQVKLSGRKILVVDDDMRTVYAVSALLRAKGAEVIVADTGRVALQMLEEHRDIALVLMDIMMPEMDGYEAMRRIRQLPEFRGLPLIALTAKAMRNDRELCLEAGATDYMPKPIDADLLLTMLETHLQKEQARAAGQG